MSKLTEGIVLKSIRTGESDITAYVITEELGLLPISIKGIRKSSHRPLSIVDTGTLASFTLPRVFTNKPSVASEVSVITQRNEIRDTLKKIVFTDFLCELILKTTQQHTPERYMYQMLRSAIDYITHSTDEEKIALFFIIHLTRHLGIMPEILNCSLCGKTDTNDFHFSMQERKMYCRTCSKKTIQDMIKVTHAQRIFTGKALSIKYSSIEKHDFLNNNETISLLYVFVSYIQEYYRIHLQTGSFIFS